MKCNWGNIQQIIIKKKREGSKRRSREKREKKSWMWINKLLRRWKKSTTCISKYNNNSLLFFTITAKSSRSIADFSFKDFIFSSDSSCHHPEQSKISIEATTRNSKKHRAIVKRWVDWIEELLILNNAKKKHAVEEEKTRSFFFGINCVLSWRKFEIMLIPRRPDHREMMKKYRH